MLEDAEVENLSVVPVDQSRVDLTNTARGKPETNNQHDIIVGILHSEFDAAMCLMEHRESWWMEGMHNAESAVGMEMGRVRKRKVLAADDMNAQMTSLTETLRTMQNRAEQSTHAAL